MMNKRIHQAIRASGALCLMVLLTGCAVSLRNAKHSFVQGQEYSRSYLQEEAYASFKATRAYAEKSIARNPSAQAYVVKGMAEIPLEMWEEAAKSFQSAFSLGFEKGEEWAEWISLYGFGLSLEQLGLEKFALRVFENLVARSRLRPVTMLAAGKFSEISLKNALKIKEEDREKILKNLLKKVEGLTQKDMSCGYYHYLVSQVSSHLLDFRMSFEEAIAARELGLPTLDAFRDNDLQIIYCFRKLNHELEGKEREEFLAVYNSWRSRWGWPAPDVPDWKQDQGQKEH